MGGLRFFGLLALLGALWGAAEGLWIVAPTLASAHWIVPTGPVHWLVLESTILVVSAGLGMLIALFGSVVLIAWPLMRRRPYRDPVWAVGLALGALLPLAYLGTSLLMEWDYFGRLPHFRDWRVVGVVAAGIAVYLGGLVALVATYRSVTSREPHLP